jgi:hypothetical protein
MSKKRYFVHCLTHGVESKNYAGKQVAIPAPKPTKKDRLYGGCPLCRQKKQQ